MPCTGSLLATLLDSVPQNREGISCLGNARGKNHFRPCGRERDAMHYCKRLRTEPRVANSVPQQNGISCLLETRGKNYFQKDHVPVEENVMRVCAATDWEFLFSGKNHSKDHVRVQEKIMPCTIANDSEPDLPC